MTARIRLATTADAEAIAAIYRPFVADTVISFETVAPDREEMTRRLTETSRRYPWLVCEADDRVAGYVYATTHRVRAAYQWSVDTAVYIDHRYHRTGMGRGLYVSLLGLLQAQGFFNAYAGITLPNAGSVGLHEAMGFQKVGVYSKVGFKLGAWHDVGWWELAVAPHRDTPGEPLGMAELAAQPEFHALLARGEAYVQPRAD